MHKSANLNLFKGPPKQFFPSEYRVKRTAIVFLILFSGLNLFAQNVSHQDVSVNTIRTLKELGFDKWRCQDSVFQLLIKELSPQFYFSDTSIIDNPNYSNGYNLTGYNPLLFTSFYERRTGFKGELENELYDYQFSRYYIRPDSKLIISFNQCFLRQWSEYFKDQLLSILYDRERLLYDRETINNKVDLFISTTENLRHDSLTTMEKDNFNRELESIRAQIQGLYSNYKGNESMKTLDSLSGIEIKMRASIKSIQGNTFPVPILGYYEVNKSPVTKGSEPSKSNQYDSTFYSFTEKIYPIQLSQLHETQVDLSNYSLVPGDQIVIEIINSSKVAHNVGFTATFVVEEQGWQHGPTTSLAFIKAFKGEADINFRAGVSLAYDFYRKPRMGKNNFWHHLLVPSFGPHLIAFSEENTAGSDFKMGMGLQASWLYRTINIGGGMMFEDGPYFQIGLNFISGIQAIGSALNTRVGSSGGSRDIPPVAN